MSLAFVLTTLDYLHLASALRIGAGLVTVATHDAATAHAAAELGFDIVDPVTQVVGAVAAPEP